MFTTRLPSQKPNLLHHYSSSRCNAGTALRGIRVRFEGEFCLQMSCKITFFVSNIIRYTMDSKDPRIKNIKIKTGVVKRY